MDGTFTGVVDRIVDGKTAVILLEDDGAVVEQFDVDVTEVPTDARTDGSVLAVTVVDGEFVDVEYLPEETESRLASAQERFDRLSERLPDS